MGMFNNETFFTNIFETLCNMKEYELKGPVLTFKSVQNLEVV